MSFDRQMSLYGLYCLMTLFRLFRTDSGVGVAPTSPLRSVRRGGEHSNRRLDYTGARPTLRTKSFAMSSFSNVTTPQMYPRSLPPPPHPPGDAADGLATEESQVVGAWNVAGKTRNLMDYFVMIIIIIRSWLHPVLKAN